MSERRNVPKSTHMNLRLFERRSSVKEEDIEKRKCEDADDTRRIYISNRTVNGACSVEVPHEREYIT